MNRGAAFLKSSVTWYFRGIVGALLLAVGALAGAAFFYATLHAYLVARGVL